METYVPCWAETMSTQTKIHVVLAFECLSLPFSLKKKIPFSPKILNWRFTFEKFSQSITVFFFLLTLPFISRLVSDNTLCVLFYVNFRDGVKNLKPKVSITLEVVLVVEKKGHDMVLHLCLEALRKHGKLQSFISIFSRFLILSKWQIQYHYWLPVVSSKIRTFFKYAMYEVKTWNVKQLNVV